MQLSEARRRKDTRHTDELRIIEQHEEGSMVIEVPADLPGYLQRVASYAKVTLGGTQGSFANLPVLGPRFMWKDGERAEMLPWADAVKRFGPPIKS
jgi:hypothetical protein